MKKETKSSRVQYVQDVDKWIKYYVSEAKGLRNPHTDTNRESDVFAIEPASVVKKVELTKPQVVSPSEQTVQQAKEDVKRDYKRKATSMPTTIRRKKVKAIASHNDVFNKKKS